MTGLSSNTGTFHNPVVHIAPTPFFSNRGCHIRIFNEVEGLKQHNVRVIVCTYGLGGDVEGVDIRRIWPIPGYTKTSAGFSIFKPIADILLFFLALGVCWKERPAVIHGHLHEGGLIAWCVRLVFFWRRIRVIMDVQGSLSGELKAYGTFRKIPFLLPCFYLIERIVSLLPDLIVCSSKASLQFMQRECKIRGDKLELVGDVVPETFFASLDKGSERVHFHLPDDRKIVLYSGSLLPGKGIDLLIEALKTVLKNRKDCFFILIGYPKDQVEAEIRRTAMADRVLLPGEVSYFELPRWLATADLAVDPKSSGSGEASGKIMHYMAGGLAIVCFSSENNRQFLGDQAFFAQEESGPELARIIDLALTEDESRNKYGASCRERARKHFSLAAVGEQLKTIYQQGR